MSPGDRIRRVTEALTAAVLAFAVVGLRPALADSPLPVGGHLQVNISVSPGPGQGVVPAASASVGTTSGVSLHAGAGVLPPTSVGVARPGASPVQASTGNVSTTGLGTAGPEGTSSPASGSAAPSVGSSPARSSVNQDLPSGGSEPAICPALVFRPMIAGCESVLGPITGSGLAGTGSSFLAGLVGVLLMVLGGAVYARFRHQPAPWHA